MTSRATGKTTTPATLHPRNLHQGRYNLPMLVKANPSLKPFVVMSPYGQKTIDFANDQAVIALNKALLSHYYKITNWSIPEGFLCPPIPGRADYIHHAADLLAKSNGKRPPKGKDVSVLDIGTGANLVYPIIGNVSYGWQFVASEINERSYQAAKTNVKNNVTLTNQVKLIKQNDAKKIFKGVIQASDRFSLTLCNPPFHASAKEAQAGTARKVENLAKHKSPSTKGVPWHPKKAVETNFGGQHSELWCDGGEVAFIRRMIRESKEFEANVCWFTCLVSKSEHLKAIKKTLKEIGAVEIEIIKMAQGQKVSRFVAWTFLTDEQRKAWFKAL
ncbi:23S rRNA (adenine(1618)-N(6))-methyltransferase RlmF [Reinekea sp.]|jgi:23S rRNA (adenine1618-N6)-methyltransferase|uniref:23S rRNA (adenine(1618)-N(6))-methyltransferase RlmF n=1 Tax=Reinekea sp. TaxID=1970455 RepID=UPI00398A2631